MLTPEEMALRKGRITSSVVYDVLYNPHRAWRRVLQLDAPFTNEAIEIGNALEGPVRDLGASRLGLTATKETFRPHAKLDWAGDSVDATLRSGDDLVAIAEVKTAGSRTASSYENGPPLPVYLQCQWHLMHWPEVDRCHVFALLGRSALTVEDHLVERDPEMEEMLLQATEKFWHTYIRTETEPPADTAQDTLEWIKKRHAVGDGSSIAVDSEFMAVLRERNAARDELRSIEARVRETDARIRQAMGAAQCAEYKGIVVAKMTDVTTRDRMVKGSSYRRLTVPKGVLDE